ncbi:hypothetical protein ACFL6C_01170 [Myxococcota bacterium]
MPRKQEVSGHGHRACDGVGQRGAARNAKEVHDALKSLEKHHPAWLDEVVPAPGQRFRFGTTEENVASYWYYLRLGNELMRNVSTKKLLGKWCPARFDLHAKVFEWCLLSCL